MLADFCALVRAEQFSGLLIDGKADGVYSHFVPQQTTDEKDPLPAILCRRVGHDPLQTLDDDEPDDLQFTDVELTVFGHTPAEAFPIGEALFDWLRNYTGAMGTRTVVGVMVREDLEDLAEPADDGSDVWRVGVQFTVQVQHKPAA